MATGLKNVSFHSNAKERQCRRMLNYDKIALIPQASKEMLKILQARLQQCINQELSGVQAGLRKGSNYTSNTGTFSVRIAYLLS